MINVPVHHIRAVSREEQLYKFAKLLLRGVKLTATKVFCEIQCNLSTTNFLYSGI